MQTAFFAVFSMINFTYQTKILESSKAIADYLSQQKLDEAAVAESILQQKSILGDDPLSISRHFNDIVGNFRIYFFYIFVLFIVFGSISWALTNKLVYKIGLRQLTNIFFKNLAVSLFYLGLIFGFFYLLLNISITQLAAESPQFFLKYAVFSLFSVALLYFMFVSLSLVNRIELKNIVQRTLSTGIRKAHYVLSAYLINIILLLISMFLLYYFIENNPFILLLSIILLIFSFIFGRIFIINVFGKLEQ